MTSVLIGAISGFVMLLIFLMVTPLIIFSLVRDQSHWSNRVIRRAKPITLMLLLVLLAYPICGGVGIVLSFMYDSANTDNNYRNLIPTILLIIALLSSITFAILFRRVAIGFAFILIAFVVIYGWLLPLLLDLSRR